MKTLIPISDYMADKRLASYLVAIPALQDGNFSPSFPSDTEPDPLWLELRKLATILEQNHDKEIGLTATLLDSVNDAAFLIDRQCKINYANEMACRAHGYTLAEMLEMDMRTLFSPDQTSGFHFRMAVLTLRGHDVFETTNLRKDGTIRPMVFYVRSIIFNGSLFYLAVARDITDRKLAQKQ
ncbi:MAG: PAS domain S-box protein [Nitrosomonadales bacterium]|nr:PAS domain S-box protein [Nitrosomonadales bacterium]